MNLKKLALVMPVLMLSVLMVNCQKPKPAEVQQVNITKIAENVYSYNLGNDISVISTFDIEGGLDTKGELVPPQNKGVCEGDNNIFLLKTPNEVVLFDSGYGDKNAAPKLFANLANINMTPESITKIVMTHMHPDHVGGLTSGPSFFGNTPARIYPNAKIYVNKAELEFWTQETLAAGAASPLYYINPGFLPEGENSTFFNFGKSLVKAMQAVYGADVNTFDNVSEVANIAGIGIIKSRAMAGHTPGHTGYLISGAKKMLIGGDFVNCGSIQLDDTSVAAIYDYNFATATATRIATIEYLMANDLVVAGTHLPKPGFVKISKGSADGKYIFVPEK